MEDIAKILSRIEKLEKMLSTQMKNAGLLQTCDCWAQGANDGGRYVSLFNSRAGFRLCAVYQEEFEKLPDFIKNNLGSGDLAEISTEKGRCEKKGILKQCNPFGFTRWRMGSDDEETDKEKKWRFGEVVWIKGAAQPAQQQNRPLKPSQTQDKPSQGKQPIVEQPKQVTIGDDRFANMADALNYAVQAKVYSSTEAAKAQYEKIKADGKPSKPGAMWSLWLNHIESRLPKGS